MSTQRNTVGATLLLVCLLGCGATASRNEGNNPPRIATESQSLASRSEAFLIAVQSRDRELISSFFPKQGTLTYTYFHRRRSGDSISEVRFEAAKARQEIMEGELGEPLAPVTHAFRYGSLYFGATKGVDWVRVNKTRFVPPSRGPSSAIYVEWRREGGLWVVSAFGDEGFEEIPGS